MGKKAVPTNRVLICKKLRLSIIYYLLFFSSLAKQLHKIDKFSDEKLMKITSKHLAPLRRICDDSIINSNIRYLYRIFGVYAGGVFIYGIAE